MREVHIRVLPRAPLLNLIKSFEKKVRDQRSGIEFMSLRKIIENIFDPDILDLTRYL